MSNTIKPFYINKPINQVPSNLTTAILKSSDALKFHSSLSAYKPTALVELPELAQHFQVKTIFVKDESFRFGLNAFKALGASYAIHKIVEKNPEVGTFCTATDGNHGRAVAWAAKLSGKRAVIYVPAGTSSSRIEAIRKEGAVVEEIDKNYDGTCAYAKNMSREKGWKLVQDTAWEGYEEIPAHIMAGYLTHYQEMENSLHQSPEAGVDIVFLQAGVGSWPASAVWYYQNRYGAKKPALVIVEPTASNGILTSLKRGKRSNPTGDSNTMMAGLNCGIPSLSAWEIIKPNVDLAMEIDDSFAKEGIRKLYYPEGNDQRIISGESGVGGFAGFLALMTDARYKEAKESLNINENSRILFYSTEGDTDPENFKKIID